MSDNLTHYMKACGDLCEENTNLKAHLAAMREALERIKDGHNVYGLDHAGDITDNALTTNAGKPEAKVIAAARAWTLKWQPSRNAIVKEDGCPISMNPEAWALIQAVKRLELQT